MNKIQELVEKENGEEKRIRYIETVTRPRESTSSLRHYRSHSDTRLVVKATTDPIRIHGKPNG